MALVEPREGDELFEVEGLKFSMGKREGEILKELGGTLAIRYNEGGYWPGFRINPEFSPTCC
jgi:hypothetical protein